VHGFITRVAKVPDNDASAVCAATILSLAAFEADVGLTLETPYVLIFKQGQSRRFAII
jgi:hypothetical protein